MLDKHDNDAHLRWKIAMPVQYNDGMLYANEMVHVTWSIGHDADYDARMIMLLFYARKEMHKIWCAQA